MEINELCETQLDSLWKGNRPDRIFWYKNQSGDRIGGVARWNDKPQSDSKTIRLIRRVEGALESKDWEYGAIETPRPLYNLPNIINNAEVSVLIVEGEKTAEAAQQLFPDFVVTTTMGGANSPSKTDFVPLEGRDIIISPDNDTAGDAYARRIITLCRQANAASIKILSPKIFTRYKIFNGMLVAREESLPQGYDLADAIEEGWTLGLLKEAGNQIKELYSESKEVLANEDSDGLPFGYTLNKNGLFYDDSQLCSYINVVALTRDESNKNWGRLIELTDPDGKTHRLSIPMVALAGDSNELIKQLLSFGLRMDSSIKARSKIVNYLQNTQIKKRIFCVPKIGWHQEHFVLPNEVVPASDRIVLQSDVVEIAGHATAGSLQKWQEHIAYHCKGNSRLLLALSAAFAAPLLSLIGHENFGFHFKGASSIGKTTALQVAASVWGSPKLQESWKATANAFEAVAVSHNDSLLCLDELGQADGKDVGDVVYMLANGSGKSRMKAKGDLRKKLTWKTLVLSTGEVSIEDKLNEFNRKPQAGMLARLIEIPADTESGHRLFDTIHHFKQSSEFANHLKEYAQSYYGSAIRIFLTNAINYKEQLPELLENMNNKLLSQFDAAPWCGQVKRVAKHFALVALAGELAIELKVLPFEKEEVFRGVIKCVHAWINARGGDRDQELVAGVAHVRRFFEEHHSSRFAWDDKRIHEKPTPNLAGYKRKVNSTGEETGIEFFVYPETFRSDICRGFNAQELLREFARRGILKRGNNRQLVSEKRLPIGKKKIYHFLSSILEDTDEDNLDHLKDTLQIYGDTGVTVGYTSELINIQRGVGVTTSKEFKDDCLRDRGDNTLDNITFTQECHPSHFINEQTGIVDQSNIEIKGSRGMSPLSLHLPRKNTIAPVLEELTDAIYEKEERLAIQDDYH